ncbi:hypothetical protein M378DRAFT_7402 [Amanita muscaria Koide BX008]|uniref:Uncharacterized protein n=1 Tax=Amanita muscaria (strain Koide BX008) TaxID=946122 RepID=A0A0C2TQM9_AMAMK|nr:hypothetical protein M378DRAFT_7402 [Amanita muscaria Koide BX008]
MASNAHRRRAQRKKQQRSFLDAIKNIVTAPFSWFAPTDYLEDVNGKRRRLPSPPSDQDEHASPRVKRPRIDSPKAAYLDPPSHVFRHNQPVRSALGVSRTMSLDPPARPLRRESAIAQISFQRDLSMPPMPISARSSFLTRSSLTPQPSQSLVRESSEPPPLSSLAINPVFVRAPSSQPTEVQQRASAQTITLGSLADSTRSTRSPVRQHSSLLFSTSPSIQSKTLRQESPAEKALHELDIYKTPLLPTRLRSSNSITQSASLLAPPGAPDLFGARRTQKLVLMQDEKRSIRLGTQAKKASLANNTKPYAGEGGMKKLLARRKLEEVPEEEDGDQVAHVSKKDAMDDDAGEPAMVVPTSGHATEKKDWFAVASNETRPSTSVSSLRVGRDKKRNHIARPKATYVRSKFSAAFDEDMDMDETMDDATAIVDEDKEKVSNDTFIFNPPPGFSFAKDGTADAKELPISSLPFSLTKKTQDLSSSASKHSNSVPLPSLTIEYTSPKKQMEFAFSEKPSSSDAGVPDFFAKSKILSKPIEVPAFPQSFRLAPVQGALPSGSDKSSEPVWEPTTTPTDGPSIFALSPEPSSQPQQSSLSVSTDVSPTRSDNGPSVSSAAKQILMETKEATEAQISTVNVTQPNRVAEITVSTDSGDTMKFPLPGDLGKTSLPALGGAQDSKNNPTEDQAEKPVFGHTIEQTSSSSNAFKLPVLNPPFSFTQPSSSVETSKSEVPSRSSAPKLSLGGFTFNQTASTAEKDKPQASNETNFMFGASQSEQKKALPSFSFGGSQLQTSVPTSSNIFPFGGGGSVGSDVSKPFVFGPSATTLPERPVTPPKLQDQEVQMDESPARDIQSTEQKPPVTLGFSFGTSTATSTLFGTQTSGNASSSPFAFGSTNAFSTPTKETKPAQDKPISFAPASAFPFGQNAAFEVTSTAQSPISSLPTTAQPFSFGSNATSFPFGAQSAPASNPFGQTHPGSAPSSPATFGAPFSFGAPASNAFAFGSSQPASPAGGSNIALPQQPSSTGFSGTGFGQSAPSSPFSASSPLTPSAPTNGALFTIGSAPMSSPNAPRQIKKLPTRRAGAKR